MGVWDIIGGIVLALVCLGIIILVALQDSPKGYGVSALTGSDSYYSKNQGRSLDFILSKWTKYLAVALFVVAVAVYAITIYLK